MKSRARLLIEKSIDAMLGAIEVYNKPAFGYREEAFAILAINAWELLLKARILQIDGNRLAAILEYDRRPRADGTPSVMLYRRRNRAGNFLTLSLFKAYDRLINDYKDTIDSAIRANLEALVEVRDNAVHYFNKDFDLSRAIHGVGAANLKNYVGIARQWFAVDFSQYRLFLMPLAFVSAAGVVEGIAVNAEERHLLEYLERLHKNGTDDPSRDFNVALTIEVQVRRTKSPTATPVVVSNAPNAIPITVDEADIRERYPWSYDILTAKLQKRYSDFKMNNRYHEIRKPLEANVSLCRERLLDPGNPKSARKRFYNSSILKEFDMHYQRATTDSVAALTPLTETNKTG